LIAVPVVGGPANRTDDYIVAILKLFLAVNAGDTCIAFHKAPPL
jgi:hypothetical protein